MSTATALVVAVLVVVAIWTDSMRAREHANRVCTQACHRMGLQFLDQTVVIRRIGLTRSARGLRIRRVYGFDYSDDGEHRHHGTIVLVGRDVETLLFAPEAE